MEVAVVDGKDLQVGDSDWGVFKLLSEVILIFRHAANQLGNEV